MEIPALLRNGVNVEKEEGDRAEASTPPSATLRGDAGAGGSYKELCYFRGTRTLYSLK